MGILRELTGKAIQQKFHDAGSVRDPALQNKVENNRGRYSDLVPEVV